MFSSHTTNIAYTILIEISQYFNIITNITAELFSDDFCKSKLNLLLYICYYITAREKCLLTFSKVMHIMQKVNVTSHKNMSIYNVF